MEETLQAHLRQPILKILHSHGITKASSISLQVFASLLDKYLKSTVESCQEYANHAGRTSLSVDDVLESLEEMGTVLDDLKDYLEVECGVASRNAADGAAVPPAAEPSGVQKYAKVLGVRKETELHEFKGQIC
jgi:histone H3/H4